MSNKTDAWFNDAALAQIAGRYRGKFAVMPVSYATVKDFCDSFDNLRPLATASLDLKDVQRPWMLKAILGSVSAGGRVLEIGAGEPWVADILARLGYEAWVVDPYDGSGNGPHEFDVFRQQSPKVQFIRAQFSDQLNAIVPLSFDCIYSISVLEHLAPASLRSVAQGMKLFLRRDGISLHAVDHVHRGNGAAGHLANLESMTRQFGLSPELIQQTLRGVDWDTETYFFSAEGHNRWRGATPYAEFPMRVCVSVQLFSRLGEFG